MAPYSRNMKPYKPKPKPKPNPNPKVFFDISIARKSGRRIIMELFNDVPQAGNFLALCIGEKGFCYKGSSFHRESYGVRCQGGDLTARNEPSSILAPNYERKHTGPGILSMAKDGAGSNGSQFFICNTKIEPLDGKHVVFGQIIEGMDVVNDIVKAVDKVGPMFGRTSKPVVVDCGKVAM